MRARPADHERARPRRTARGLARRRPLPPRAGPLRAGASPSRSPRATTSRARSPTPTWSCRGLSDDELARAGRLRWLSSVAAGLDEIVTPALARARRRGHQRERRARPEHRGARAGDDADVHARDAAAVSGPAGAALGAQPEVPLRRSRRADGQDAAHRRARADRRGDRGARAAVRRPRRGGEARSVGPPRRRRRGRRAAGDGRAGRGPGRAPTTSA